MAAVMPLPPTKDIASEVKTMSSARQLFTEEEIGQTCYPTAVTLISVQKNELGYTAWIRFNGVFGKRDPTITIITDKDGKAKFLVKSTLKTMIFSRNERTLESVIDRLKDREILSKDFEEASPFVTTDEMRSILRICTYSGIWDYSVILEANILQSIAEKVLEIHKNFKNAAFTHKMNHHCCNHVPEIIKTIREYRGCTLPLMMLVDLRLLRDELDTILEPQSITNKRQRS
jgi:hypothetical protein